MKQILLCHYHKDAPEVHMLADELRLRGIVPWVDKQGGFSIGDNQIDEAERVLRGECFGLLLYGTEPTFGRDFIRKVEVETALRVKEDDPSFLLVAIPRGIGFEQLRQLGIDAFGVDFTRYASEKVEEPVGTPNEDWLREQLVKISNGVLDKYLAYTASEQLTSVLQMQFSTRDRLRPEYEDLLCIDATRLTPAVALAQGPDQWARIYEGLLDVKAVISRNFGRPRLRVHGSKHLTAAFALGFVFPSTVCELDIRTKHGYWSTDHPAVDSAPFDVTHDGGVPGSSSLYVEISTGDHSVRSAVRRNVQRSGSEPFHYVRFRSRSDQPITNEKACQMAKQIRSEIASVVSTKPIDEVHIFAAIPQALATFVGHRMNALPPIHLYEYEGHNYAPSLTLKQGNAATNPQTHCQFSPLWRRVLSASYQRVIAAVPQWRKRRR